jgi:hypothetical protein
MRLAVFTVAFLAAVAPAAATEGTWPIEASVDYPGPADIGPDGAKATVRISVGDDASAIDVRVYGIDGMRVGVDNLARVDGPRLANGEAFAFDIVIHPGPGRSFLVVMAKAHFARAGDGSAVQSFPFGDENAEQQAEHSRCVRQDPDGVWIRDPGCEDAPAPATIVTTPPALAAPPPAAILPAVAPPGLPPVVLTLGEFMASPPVGRIARVVG